MPEYELNLVNLIQDVRQALHAPKPPFVIGELTGRWVQAPGEWDILRKAQAAAAARPEFADNVVLSRPTTSSVSPKTRQILGTVITSLAMPKPISWSGRPWAKPWQISFPSTGRS